MSFISILPFSSANAVRGPRHVVKRGKTPMLDVREARQPACVTVS